MVVVAVTRIVRAHNTIAMNSISPRLLQCCFRQRLATGKCTLLLSRFMSVQKDRANFVPLPENHFVLSGFTQFASRADLKLALGSVTPQEVIPLLDRKLLFIGKYQVVVNPEEVGILKENLKKFNGSLSLHSTIYSDQIFNAAQLNITSRCIRTLNLPSNLAVHDVEYFFEDFHVAEPGIVRISHLPLVKQNFSRVDSKATSQFLVHFADEFEAERAMMELDGKVLKDGADVQLWWYRA